MAETYSLGVTGILAGQVQQVANLSVPDSCGRPGAQSLAMQTGSQVLCKRPDGSQGYFVLDAERSLPGGPLVMRPVGP